jgi:hypothetical protein
MLGRPWRLLRSGIIIIIICQGVRRSWIRELP